MLSDIQLEEEQKVLVEYAHLKAEIVQRLSEEEISIRISVKDGPIKVPKELEDRTEFEKKWRFLRQMFVNQIFANTKKGSSLYIKGSVMKGYYKWVQTERGLADDMINNINLSRKVFWFLKELSEVGPDTSSSDPQDEARDLNRQKLELLRQHLLSKMDDTAFLKNVALKFKSLKSANPEMEPLFKQLEAGKVKVENYGLFGKLLREIFDGEDESMSQHIALLDHLHKAIKTNNPSEVLINQLRRDSGNSLEIKNFPRPKEDEVVTKNAEGEDLEDRKYKNTAKTAGNVKNTRDDLANLDDFENFILTEIEKAAKQNAQDSKKSSTNPESGKSDRFSDPKESNIDSQTRNGSKDVDRRNKIDISLEKKGDFLKQIELKDADIQETSVVPEDKWKRPFTTEKPVGKDDGVREGFPKSSLSQAKSMDERQKLLEEIQKELGDSRKNSKNELDIKSSKTKEQARSTDPLEEFKKPVWASDEGKITKEFSEFQQKPEISSGEYGSTEENDFAGEYEEEYAVEDEIDRKDNSGRIGDEL